MALIRSNPNQSVSLANVVRWAVRTRPGTPLTPVVWALPALIHRWAPGVTPVAPPRNTPQLITQPALAHRWQPGPDPTLSTGGGGGSSITGTFDADGLSTAVFDSLSGLGTFEADGFATADFTSILTVAGTFESDGTSTAIYITGSGAVSVLCITTGFVGSPAAPTLGSLYDAPSSY